MRLRIEASLVFSEARKIQITERESSRDPPNLALAWVIRKEETSRSHDDTFQNKNKKNKIVEGVTEA